MSYRFLQTIHKLDIVVFNARVKEAIQIHPSKLNDIAMRVLLLISNGMKLFHIQWLPLPLEPQDFVHLHQRTHTHNVHNTSAGF